MPDQAVLTRRSLTRTILRRRETLENLPANKIQNRIAASEILHGTFLA